MLNILSLTSKMGYLSSRNPSIDWLSEFQLHGIGAWLEKGQEVADGRFAGRQRCHVRFWEREMTGKALVNQGGVP